MAEDPPVDWPGASLRERARAERQRRLEKLAEAVEACDCLWPLQVYRNGSGHDPACPAYRPFGARGSTRG